MEPLIKHHKRERETEQQRARAVAVLVPLPTCGCDGAPPMCPRVSPHLSLSPRSHLGADRAAPSALQAAEPQQEDHPVRAVRWWGRVAGEGEGGGMQQRSHVLEHRTELRAPGTQTLGTSITH